MKPRNPHLVALLALAALSLLACFNSLSGGFVLDNRGLILNDPRLRDATASNLQLILDHTYWWPNGESGLYRPFTTLTYLFNYSILGNRDQPQGYHWLNLLLHLANILLVYALSLRLVRKPSTAFFIAALWAVHPVLTESVTNIVGRADLLAAFAILAGLLLYLRAVDSGAWLPLAALAVVSAIGAFSKETAAILPAVLLLHALTFRRQGRMQLYGLLAAALPVAAMLIQRAAVLSHTLPMEIPFTDNPIPHIPNGFLTALTVLARDFALILWPATLSADYSFSQIPLFTGAPRDWLALAFVAALLPLLVLLYRRNKPTFFLFATGLLWLAPVANILVPTGAIMAERFLYLPVLGVTACLVVLAQRYLSARPAAALLGLLLLALTLRTLVRNQDWHDDLSIASASVLSSPQSFKVHDLRANVLFASDPSHANLDRVIAESETSLAILEPLSAAQRPPAPYRFAANCYMLKSAWPKAIAALRNYLAAESAHLAALEARVGAERAREAQHASKLRQADALLVLASAYLEASDTAHAAEALAQAGEIDSLNPQLYRETADVAAAAGKLDDAAVALVEGSFVTGDPSFRQSLVELYQHAMDPRGCALTAGPSGPAINPACGIVHGHVCAAAARTVKVLAAAGQAELSQTRKKMFVEQFGCPL